jgi:adenosylcobinamide-GDP ribazoletransferase
LPEPGARWPAGIRLALTTFTVAPVPRAPVSRAAARVAMGCAPLVGALLGFLVGAVALGLRALAAPALVTGAAVVALGALLTRGLHLDGLADTADGLGSYAGRERALEIMREPEVGPFGVVAIALAILLQAAAVAGLAARTGGGLALLAAVVTGTAAGRLGVAVACRRGVPAARPHGLGALVAGTVSGPVLAAGTAGVGAVALAAVPARMWQGPVAVGVALLCGLVLERHAVRRLGGITGDVLGAILELVVTVSYLGLALG